MGKENAPARGAQRERKVRMVRGISHGQPPPDLNGKEGVDGSSPSEGSAKAPHVGVFSLSSICKNGSVQCVWSRLWSFRVENPRAPRVMRASGSRVRRPSRAAWAASFDSRSKRKRRRCARLRRCHRCVRKSPMCSGTNRHRCARLEQPVLAPGIDQTLTTRHFRAFSFSPWGTKTRCAQDFLQWS